MLKLQSGQFLTTTAAERDLSSVRITETVYTLGQRLPRHTHDRVYVVVLTSGVLRETARGREHDLTRGHVVFNGAGATHEDVVDSRATRCLNIELRPTFLERLGDTRFRASESVMYTHLGAAIGAVGRLQSALMDPNGELEVEEALTEMIGAAVLHESPRRDAFGWLDRTLDFLHSTFDRGVLLDDVTEIAGVHRTHLCRSFRTATGCTIGEYVRRLRADRVHQRLTDDEASLAMIAMECGYSDQSHMTREFRRVYGRSPSSVRRSSR